MSNEWIEHKCGPRAINPHDKIYVKFEDGYDDSHFSPSLACFWDNPENPQYSNWETRDGENGIIAYRVVQQ